MKKSTVLLVLALLLVQGAAFGQAQRGTVTVTVLDATGSPLPGVSVEATSDQTLTRRTVLTGTDGVASLTALDPAGNYVVTAALEGFNGARAESVAVTAGTNLPLNFKLDLATVSEQLVVTSEAPVVDMTSAQTGQQLTLELVESLPTARTYQDYLQLVPGVQPSVVDEFGNDNPASRSGTNYQDIFGTVGDSRDNFYYFEGINITDSVSGVAGANINTEIIQEQSVLTGGLPAEYIGATGLVSNVLTKSGGNSFSGSVNYYFQDDSLVEDNSNRADQTFSTYDTAVTLGGPIVGDKAWFFASYRLVNREQDVVDVDDNPLRTVTRDDDQAFAKLSWAPTQSGVLSGIFLSDPFELDGTFDDQTSNQRDQIFDRGGDRFTLTYAHVFSNFSVEAGYAEHNRDVNDLPKVLDTRSDITFRGADGAGQSLNALQKGGQGTLFVEERGSDVLRGSAEYLADTSWGSHTLKAGLELSEMNDFRNFETAGDGGIYTSIAALYRNLGITALTVANEFDNLSFDPTNSSDLNGLNLFASPVVLGLLDADHDGTISQAEAEAIVFNSVAGNPYGDINYDRTFQTSSGAQFTKSEGTAYYVQDTWQFNRWAVNLGFRAEQWDHFATDDSNIYTFDYEYAPRLSVAYDLKGNGRQRITGYYGRYYDPIRNNMTNFAGSITGRERHEQVFVTTDAATGAGVWQTYRIRGGPVQADAFFAPSTQTPYTDEYQLGYKIDLGRNMSFEANAIKRETGDILEDYDLHLYSDPDGYGLPVNDPNSLFLPLSYFGYAGVPDSNFVIATLAGGVRDWEGLEFIFRKRLSNHWQGLASYNYADGEGNTNSDSNADFQGDVLFLDPRAANQLGTQPGLVEHLLKLAGTYQWDNGISAGAAYRWNSGSVVSRTFFASSRNLPVRDFQDPQYTGPPISFAGGSGNGVPGGAGRWLSPLSVGQFDNPSYGVLDLRVSYLWSINDNLNADFFLDVFNAIDDQNEIRLQDIILGNSGVAFGEGLDFVGPRRYYLGARLRF